MACLQTPQPDGAAVVVDICDGIGFRSIDCEGCGDTSGSSTQSYLAQRRQCAERCNLEVVSNCGLT